MLKILMNFIMLVNYANQLCYLMAGQINKKSDKNDDLKGHMSCERRRIISYTISNV